VLPEYDAIEESTLVREFIMPFVTTEAESLDGSQSDATVWAAATAAAKASVGARLEWNVIHGLHPQSAEVAVISNDAAAITAEVVSSQAFRAPVEVVVGVKSEAIAAADVANGAEYEPFQVRLLLRCWTALREAIAAIVVVVAGFVVLVEEATEEATTAASRDDTSTALGFAADTAAAKEP
jgi:hypothetical protein